MGIHKFRLPPDDAPPPPPEARKGFFVGPDRTPMRTMVELRPGMLLTHRDVSESGMFHVPWPVPGRGIPMIATATLSERQAPYDLVVELARGKLNDLRNQLADWRHHLGLIPSPDLRAQLGEAQRLFARAALSQDQPEEAYKLASESLSKTMEAADKAVLAYTELLLRLRHHHATRLPTHLACVLEGDPSREAWGERVPRFCNAARLSIPWRALAPRENEFDWDALDAQMEYCREHNLTVAMGPLVEFRTESLPEWLFEFQDDPHNLLDVILDWVRQILVRYRGRVSTWHLMGRIGTPTCLGLSEEEQIEITARVLQTARQVEPHGQLVVDFDRPWAEWLGAPDAIHQLSPLHLGDYLTRVELGLAGVGLEIAPGLPSPGSHLRDLLDFSRLLDLYALLNIPLHVTIVFPSGVEPDSGSAGASESESGSGSDEAEGGERSDDTVDFRPPAESHAAQWPEPPNEARQAEWASRWIALAVSKPYVRSVTWGRATDRESSPYPRTGLFREDGSAKPIVDWLESFYRRHLGEGEESPSQSTSAST